jgi:hypothetical protein
MASGWVELDQAKLQTHEGAQELNRMLRIIFDLLPGDGDTIRDFSGYGSPENVVSAGVGSTYRRLDGGATTTLYVKTSGTGASGWTAK